MSVAFTEQAVRERRKTVTRRKGWWLDKNGRRLLLPGDRFQVQRQTEANEKHSTRNPLGSASRRLIDRGRRFAGMGDATKFPEASR